VGIATGVAEVKEEVAGIEAVSGHALGRETRYHADVENATRGRIRIGVIVVVEDLLDVIVLTAATGGGAFFVVQRADVRVQRRDRVLIPRVEAGVAAVVEPVGPATVNRDGTRYQVSFLFCGKSRSVDWNQCASGTFILAA